MKKVIILIASLTLLMSCEKWDFWNNDKEKERSPIILTRAQEADVEAGNEMAFNFLREVYKLNEGESFIVSPLSLQRALGMLLNGADGNTKEEIAKVLGFEAESIEEINEYMSTIMKGILKAEKRDKMVSFVSEDAMIINQNYVKGVNKKYSDTVQKDYGAYLAVLDFGNPDNVDMVNKRVSSKTKGMIPDLFSGFEPDIFLYLVNALSFQGKWSSAFEPSKTKSMFFTRSSGKKTRVDMMTQTGQFTTQEFESFSTLTLPYGNGSFAMNIVLPKKSVPLDSIVNIMNAELCRRIVSVEGEGNNEVVVGIPKFKTSTTTLLHEVLSNMGMPSAFDHKLADFSNISEAPISVDGGFQKSVITVDEAGTEAASATVIPLSIFTANYQIFTADHPFLYLITEYSTGAVLFAGVFDGE